MPTPLGSIGLLFGRLGLAAEFLAGALGDVLPLVRGIVLLRLARAGVRRGAAIVLAGLGDAVALLAILAVLGLAWLREPERDQAGDGGVQQLVAVVHAGLQCGNQSPLRKRFEAACRKRSCESKLRHMKQSSRWRCSDSSSAGESLRS